MSEMNDANMLMETFGKLLMNTTSMNNNMVANLKEQIQQYSSIEKVVKDLETTVKINMEKMAHIEADITVMKTITTELDVSARRMIELIEDQQEKLQKYCEDINVTKDEHHKELMKLQEDHKNEIKSIKDDHRDALDEEKERVIEASEDYQTKCRECGKNAHAGVNKFYMWVAIGLGILLLCVLTAFGMAKGLDAIINKYFPDPPWKIDNGSSTSYLNMIQTYYTFYIKRWCVSWNTTCLPFLKTWLVL